MQKITLCGDSCLECPRYTAKSEDELNEVAQLWYRVGFSDKILSNDEIKCSGCSSHKKCTYHLVECINEHGISKCNQCPSFPCNKIESMLDRTDKFEITCKKLCNVKEYDVLSKAFFNKRDNLKKVE